MVSLDGADRREEVHLSNAAPRPVSQRLGYLPIMVRSSMCHLRSMNRTELVGTTRRRMTWAGTSFATGSRGWCACSLR